MRSRWACRLSPAPHRQTVAERRAALEPANETLLSWPHNAPSAPRSSIPSPLSSFRLALLHPPHAGGCVCVCVCVCLTRTAANRRGTTCVQLGQRPIGPEEEAAAAGRGRPKAVAPRGGAGPAVMAALAGMMPPPFAAGLANLMPMMPAYPFGGHRHHPNAEEMRALVSSVPHS